MSVEPIPIERAAIAETNGERLLVIADFHAGLETVLQREGVELDPQSDARRERLLDLIADTSPDRMIILGDLVHTIGDLWEAEKDELTALFDSLDIPVVLVKGNHDGVIESVLDEIGHDITVTPTDGIRIGEIGFAHGHTWPSAGVLEAAILCVGHEHPVVRLEDSVGGRRVESVWLRGALDPAAFDDQSEATIDGELVVFPAFNQLSGGTWINVDGQDFLVPFLPEGVRDGQAYMLDGTRLGSFQQV